MLNTKSITPAERKQRVEDLRKEHQPYFEKIGKPTAIFIPKMAYRPQGKDENHISFFESELKNECDIYTEFVSKNYESEDPKRTLYLLHYNPFWQDEFELIVSNSGYERYFVPVSQLKFINDIGDRISQPVMIEEEEKEDKFIDFNNNSNEDLIKVLENINYSLQTIANVLRNK